MPNYQNSKIYKIISPSNPDLIYYGSTTQKLNTRFSMHKYKPIKSSGLILCFDDAIIVLVESYPCNTKEELLKKEGEYILNNNCVNKHTAGRTKKEYREDKTKMKAINKKYEENNKEKRAIKKKIYYEKNREQILKKLKLKNLNNSI